MGIAQDAFNNDPANAGWHMNDHGSVVATGDGTAPGKSRTLLRGNFSIVEYSSRARFEPEVFMVLQGLEPGNRKLVYKLVVPSEGETLDHHALMGSKTQDSPGMARNGWERA